MAQPKIKSSQPPSRFDHAASTYLDVRCHILSLKHIRTLCQSIEWFEGTTLPFWSGTCRRQWRLCVFWPEESLRLHSCSQGLLKVAVYSDARYFAVRRTCRYGMHRTEARSSFTSATTCTERCPRWRGKEVKFANPDPGNAEYKDPPPPQDGNARIATREKAGRGSSVRIRALNRAPRLRFSIFLGVMTRQDCKRAEAVAYRTRPKQTRVPLSNEALEGLVNGRFLPTITSIVSLRLSTPYKCHHLTVQ